MDAISENKAVGMLSELLALKCGYSPEKARQIKIAAVLHDCGKKYIPKHIRDKPDKLTAYEFNTMKNHTKIGFDMLASLQGELGEMARMVSIYHHEHWRGQGYWGVPSCTLPRYVGIVSICDVFISLLNKRVYKAPWSPEEALEYIRDRAGTQFCPDLTDAFTSLVRHDTRVAAIIRNFQEVSNDG